MKTVQASSVGRVRLREWLEQESEKDGSRNQNWLAATLGISATHVSQILSGERRPSLPLSVQLEDLTGIPARDFAEAS